jgi:hypothetical protein
MGTWAGTGSNASVHFQARYAFMHMMYSSACPERSMMGHTKRRTIYGGEVCVQSESLPPSVDLREAEVAFYRHLFAIDYVTA